MSVTESVEGRLRALRDFDPLLQGWVESGRLSDGEADLVVLAAEATQCRQPLRLALPGGSSRLAAVLATHSAVRQLALPGRYPNGPVVLLAGSRERGEVLDLTIAGEPVASRLGAARLRADGRVQLLARARTEPLTAGHRLVLVSPRSRWPIPQAALGVAVLDERSLGNTFEDAHRWAVQHADLVHVVAPLDPARSPVSHEVTWPYVASEATRWDRSLAWPVVGVVDVENAGPGPTGLEDARQRIAAAPMERQWPGPLVAAAGLSRALAGLSVPMSLYDLHASRTFAVPFAGRLEALRETGPSDLPDAWASFAATDWAPLKRRLLEAAEGIEAHNPKAELVGIVIERLLARGHQVDVWVDSQVHGQALQEHLLTGGFALNADQFAEGTIAVRPYRDARQPLREPRSAVLTGLPASWNLSGLVSGAVGGPLAVIAYDFEATRVPRYFGWMLNTAHQLRHRERELCLHRALGEGLEERPPPTPIALKVTASSTSSSDVGTPTERSTDAAELAALADDEWLSLLIQGRERRDDASGAPRRAKAFLVEPGPAVLIVARHALVDRLVAGRLRPTPASSLQPGMQVLTSTHATAGVFAAIRPHLDHARGIGTQFWLSQWDEALLEAVAVTGGPIELAAALARRGAEISPAAVASWPSPFRIGPRDEANVKRVAALARHTVAEHHHRRIHAVMRGVRIEHAQLGRRLAAAVRAHINGDADAFDKLELRYGTDIESVLGDPAVHVIRQHLADGHAPTSALGRVHTVAGAQNIFEPEEPQ